MALTQDSALNIEVAAVGALEHKFQQQQCRAVASPAAVVAKDPFSEAPALISSVQELIRLEDPARPNKQGSKPRRPVAPPPVLTFLVVSRT